MRHIEQAEVAQPNSPVTDSMHEVLHKVTGTDSKGPWTVLVMASDPVRAMAAVISMSEKEFAERKQ